MRYRFDIYITLFRKCTQYYISKLMYRDTKIISYFEKDQKIMILIQSEFS